MENDRAITVVDAIILGAGINGCGIASELAEAGLQVVVLEKNTVGSGTSSKSSRLIHGGLRYLEQFQFGLVREALMDRQELLEKYPHLVKLKPFYLPIYRSSPRPAWMIWGGLKLYDLLASRKSGHPSKIVRKTLFREVAPQLKQSGLSAVFKYYDAKTDDLKLTQTVGYEARRKGAVIHQFTTINSIAGSENEYLVHSNRGSYAAPILINATGPWIDEVNAGLKLPARYHIRKISGIHVILQGLLTRDLMFMQTPGKRIFFIIPEPENDQTIIGTTEREETDTMDSVAVNPGDVDYLINQVNKYLEDDHRISADSVKSFYIGVRPLIAHRDNPTDLSREYILDRHLMGQTNLIHVFGGKLTTYLSLARKVRELLVKTGI